MRTGAGAGDGRRDGGLPAPDTRVARRRLSGRASSLNGHWRVAERPLARRHLRARGCPRLAAEHALLAVRQAVRLARRRQDQDDRRRIPRGRRPPGWPRGSRRGRGRARAGDGAGDLRDAAAGGTRMGHPRRHPHRPGRGRCHRDAQIRLRRVGRHGEHGEPAGDFVRAGPDPRLLTGGPGARRSLRTRAARRRPAQREGAVETFFLGRRSRATRGTRSARTIARDAVPAVNYAVASGREET